MRWLGARLRILASNVRDFLWPYYLLVVQNHRAGIQASGITITVLAGVYSIALPILFPALTQGLTRSRFVGILLALLVASYILIVVSGGIARRTADPEMNARILLGGRPAKEVLFTISKRIDRSCRRTLRYSTWAENILEYLEKNTRLEGDAPFRRAELPSETWLRKQLDRLARWISLRAFTVSNLFRPETERQSAIRPSIDGTTTVPDEFPSASLRDEIGCLLWRLRRLPRKQYTELLRIEVMKLTASQELDIPPRRLCDHLFQYSPAMHRDRLAKYVQNWEEILDFRQLDPTVDMPRLREKVLLNLSFIDNTRRRRYYQKQILKNRDLHPYIVQFASTHSTSGSLQTYADALRFVATEGQAREERVQIRFSFLCRKQRAHPGFDLHTLILHALECMDSRSSFLLAGAKEVLAELEAARLDPTGGTPPQISKARLDSFRYLSFHLASLVAASRQEISKNYQTVYKEWFNGAGNTRYIVSHGYSRTVLSVLKNSLDQSAEDLPRLFFILPDQKESFDTRAMEYELKEVERLHRFHNLAAGSETHLLSLLANKGPVLVLLGAECFDDDKRVVHPRGIGDGLRSLLKDLKKSKTPCLVAVVAESYKRHGKSLATDTNFYGQHFDRIDLYPPDLIDLIITDKELPTGWRDVVLKRK